MSLSRGTGPLSGSPGGEFNFSFDGAPAHRLFFAEEPRRLRAFVGEDVVLDTRRARYLWETGLATRVYAPLEDYDMSLFTATSSSTHCPFKGDASYWSLAGLEDVLWAYESPLPEASWLAGHGALYESRVDAWMVEDARVFGHLRDPYHRVDVTSSSRSVVVRAGGVEVARTSRPSVLMETSLPLRWYVPSADVVPGLVSPAASGLQTVCAYKGYASYWDVAGIADGAWSYEAPMAEASGIAGMLCFDVAKDGVEVTLDA